MTGTDALRDKLIKIVTTAYWVREKGDVYPSPRAAVDAIMPVIAEHSAQVWDDALNNAALTLYADDTVMHNAIYAAWLSDQRRANPWREAGS